ncbi:hemerythrin domain-containing protein [Escherichia coli]
MGPISVMESEHDEAGELLEVINTLPITSHRRQKLHHSWKAMYNGINELIDDLMDHISLENNDTVPTRAGG